MKRRYDGAWGAHIVEGGVRFRLWAPAARSVNVVLVSTGEQSIPLERDGAGWFEATTAAAQAGSRYLYEIDGDLRVADPASRFQPEGAERASEVIDPHAFDWPESAFELPPREELNVYELHLGAFTPEGTYASAALRLKHLADLGVRAIELMPLSQAAGERNWGYDGVHHYAPARQYGRPEDLKAFVASAHERGIAVILDVVYNHFGPQGNYLPRYAPQFFSAAIRTPWGDGIDYSAPANDPVRRYAIDNACYWLAEYGFDGLRLDAVPAIVDTRPRHVLRELIDEARAAAARPIYLVAEDVKNEVPALAAPFDGRWGDEVHDALHVRVTGDASRYFAAFLDAPLERLGDALATEGGHRISYLQNHDQIGNRPLGERIGHLANDDAVRAALSVVLLAPGIPLLFMGQEWSASTPFLFFCDFEPNLAKRVREGRRMEFSQLAGFDDPQTLAAIVDPASAAALERSKLRWEEIDLPAHRGMLDFHRRLLHLRREAIAPLLARDWSPEGRFTATAAALSGSWRFNGGATLRLFANLGSVEAARPAGASGRLVFATHPDAANAEQAPAWSVFWYCGE